METQVLIIGGGVTGTGLARDLALRGVDCLVVEKGDINAGASGANHGLLHSGARYVSVDPESARECRDESRLLKRMAPACIEDTGGLFVALPGDDENYVADFPGLCKKCGIPVAEIDPASALQMEPALADNITAAFRVDDASVNPFKLSIDNMAHAESLGARLLLHTEVIGMERGNGRITAVQLRNRREGREFSVYPEHVINAGGAWAKEIAALAGVDLPVVRSKGSLLVTQVRAADCVVNRLRPPSDGDIIVPGGSVSILGTTSVHLDRLDSIRVTFPEVDFLITESSKMVPDLNNARYIRSFAGVRALRRGKQGGDDRSLSRSFTVLGHEEDGLQNFISTFGGKLTTYRLMAERTADLVCERIGVKAPCVTRELPLPESETGRWTEPRNALAAWMKQHDRDDTLICECDMVPLSAADTIVRHLLSRGEAPGFDAIALRSKIGKGSCQGAFCMFRICGWLYREGIFQGDDGLRELKRYFEHRWEGLRPVLWGKQLVQEQLQEAIHCGLFSMEL